MFSELLLLVGCILVLIIMSLSELLSPISNIEPLFAWYRNLSELELQECEVEDASGHWLSHFPDTFTSLVSLNIACLGFEVRLSALERLVARCPNLRSLRLNHGVPLERLSNILRRAPQLIELGTGAYSAEIRPDVYLTLNEAFTGCKHLRCLSGFWDVVPAYLPAVYSICSELTSLNLSYATIQGPELTKLVSLCHRLQRLWVCLLFYLFILVICLCK